MKQVSVCLLGCMIACTMTCAISYVIWQQHMIKKEQLDEARFIEEYHKEQKERRYG